jgi:hypothetical protein
VSGTGKRDATDKPVATKGFIAAKPARAIQVWFLRPLLRNSRAISELLVDRHTKKFSWRRVKFVARKLLLPIDTELPFIHRGHTGDIFETSMENW